MACLHICQTLVSIIVNRLHVLTLLSDHSSKLIKNASQLHYMTLYIGHRPRAVLEIRLRRYKLLRRFQLEVIEGTLRWGRVGSCGTLLPAAYADEKGADVGPDEDEAWAFPGALWGRGIPPSLAGGVLAGDPVPCLARRIYGRPSVPVFAGAPRRRKPVGIA